MQKWVKKALPSAATLFGTAAAALVPGAPSEVAAASGAALGQFVGAFVPTERALPDVVADRLNHAERARAYEAFGEAVARAWLTGGFIYTFKPPVVGYVHGMSALAWTARKFQEDTTETMGLLSTVLLYASTPMQEASANLLNALTNGLTEISRHKRGSPEAAQAQLQAGGPFGEAHRAWREAAVRDLGGAPASE